MRQTFNLNDVPPSRVTKHTPNKRYSTRALTYPNIHTYTHTYIHTYRHTYIHTYIHACSRTYMYPDIQTCMHPYRGASRHPYIDCTSIRNYMHTNIQAFLNVSI